ncbi:MAG: PAS domain-containing protein [Gammaproteobacteria bacterium]|nr:MAG: PAS domain-containing protein [Gammaproteobacteria bacterium]
MRIRAKFAAGHLVIALATLAVALLAALATRTLEEAFRAVSEETVPLIETLGELRYTVARASADANEASLALVGGARPEQVQEELDELDQSLPAFRAARRRFEALRGRPFLRGREARMLEIVAVTGREEERLLEALRALLHRRPPVRAVLERLEQVEAYEMTLLYAADAVLAEEERRSQERAQAVREAIRRTRLIAVTAGPAAVLAALALAALLMGRVIRALVELKNVGLAWRAGHLDVRLPQRVEDELGDVTRTLNEMAAALRQHEAALEAARAHLDQILDCLPDPMLVADRHGRIERVNAALQRLLGYQAAELQRRPLAELFPGAGGEPWLEALGRGEDVAGVDTVCVGGDGAAVPVRLAARALRGPGGEPQGWVCVLQPRS